MSVHLAFKMILILTSEAFRNMMMTVTAAFFFTFHGDTDISEVEAGHQMPKMDMCPCHSKLGQGSSLLDIQGFSNRKNQLGSSAKLESDSQHRGFSFRLQQQWGGSRGCVATQLRSEHINLDWVHAGIEDMPSNPKIWSIILRHCLVLACPNNEIKATSTIRRAKRAKQLSAYLLQNLLR